MNRIVQLFHKKVAALSHSPMRCCLVHDILMGFYTCCVCALEIVQQLGNMNVWEAKR